MRLSATDIYAFQALGYLGTQPRERWVASEDISEATGVARPYLVRILATLTNNQIVVSKKGSGGGYALSRDARDINLRDVMRAIDGPVAPLSCVSLKWHASCSEESRCHVRSAVWERVRDALLEVLAAVTIEDLASDFRQGVNYRLCLEHLLRPSA
ncbi:MAG: Rrf2 family transcriptional regulator [Trueperaceae bacterium]|nr:MAG: Rrf2 family transcriptional regulator [Trueperaceae bacterium]